MTGASASGAATGGRAVWLLTHLRLQRLANLMMLAYNRPLGGRRGRPATAGKKRNRWVISGVVALFMLFAYGNITRQSIVNLHRALDPIHGARFAAPSGALSDAMLAGHGDGVVAPVHGRHPGGLGDARTVAVGLGFGVAGDAAPEDAVAALQPHHGADHRQSHRPSDAAARGYDARLGVRLPLVCRLGRRASRSSPCCCWQRSFERWWTRVCACLWRLRSCAICRLCCRLPAFSCCISSFPWGFPRRCHSY